MTSYIKTQRNIGFAAVLESLVEHGTRTLNRTVKADGTVLVTAQGRDNGPWLRTQAEWDARTANLPRV